VMFDREEKEHLIRLRNRIVSQDARRAFSVLFEWSCIESPLFVFPISRGNFSAIHLSTTAVARPYADCEFAFKGAQKHVKWWFRRPSFTNLPFSRDVVLAAFPKAELKSEELEVTIDLVNQAEAQSLISFVDSLLKPIQ
jgi:hypothetical protein